MESVGELTLLPSQWKQEQTIRDPHLVRFYREGFLLETFNCIRFAVRNPERRLEESGNFYDDVRWFMDRERAEVMLDPTNKSIQFEFVVEQLSELTGIDFEPEAIREEIAKMVDDIHFGSYSKFVSTCENGIWRVKVGNCDCGCLLREIETSS
jgi:hypothetical protein